MKRARQIAQIKIAEREYQVRATAHAIERMEERGIDEEIVAADILALGKEKIKQMREVNDVAALIDEDNDVTLIVEFAENALKVVTVIDKTNVWVKKGTKVERLYK